jgi:hypothetical protein
MGENFIDESRFIHLGEIMSDRDYQKYRKKTLKGSRITTLIQQFENVALGISQVPKLPIEADLDFLSQNNEILEYHKLFQKNMGCFYRHYCASIPFILEELCRLGLGLCRVAKYLASDRKDYFTYYLRFAHF